MYTSGCAGSCQGQLCFQWNNSSSHLGEYLYLVYKYGTIIPVSKQKHTHINVIYKHATYYTWIVEAYMCDLLTYLVCLIFKMFISKQGLE